MKKQLVIMAVTALALASVYGARGNKAECSTCNKESKSSVQGEMSNVSRSQEVPEGLQPANNPKFDVGSEAVINAGHKEGMKGAKAKIVGAFETTAYEVSFTPTSGGEQVQNHKWVVKEEIKNAGEQTLKEDAEVVLDADRMNGMKGAKAKIESADKTTVYMVDYTPTTGGEAEKSHKWLTEKELSKP